MDLYRLRINRIPVAFTHRHDTDFCVDLTGPLRLVAEDCGIKVP